MLNLLIKKIILPEKLMDPFSQKNNSMTEWFKKGEKE